MCQLRLIYPSTAGTPTILSILLLYINSVTSQCSTLMCKTSYVNRDYLILKITQGWFQTIFHLWKSKWRKRFETTGGGQGGGPRWVWLTSSVLLSCSCSAFWSSSTWERSSDICCWFSLDERQQVEDEKKGKKKKRTYQGDVLLKSIITGRTTKDKKRIKAFFSVQSMWVDHVLDICCRKRSRLCDPAPLCSTAELTFLLLLLPEYDSHTLGMVLHGRTHSPPTCPHGQNPCKHTHTRSRGTIWLPLVRPPARPTQLCERAFQRVSWHLSRYHSHPQANNQLHVQEHTLAQLYLSCVSRAFLPRWASSSSACASLSFCL